jgi:hypothetical protein
MSYKPLKNEDSLSELFSNMNDVTSILKRLDTVTNFQDFLRWLNKAETINKRATILWFKNKKDNCKTEFRDYAIKNTKSI